MLLVWSLRSSPLCLALGYCLPLDNMFCCFQLFQDPCSFWFSPVKMKFVDFLPLCEISECESTRTLNTFWKSLEHFVKSAKVSLILLNCSVNSCCYVWFSSSDSSRIVESWLWYLCYWQSCCAVIIEKDKKKKPSNYGAFYYH